MITNQETTLQPKRRRGRPLGFDRCLAVKRAMRLFWERGYEGTTFDELVGAMQISPSSFYAAFGSKERLYQETVDAYMADATTWLERELDAATDARTAVETVLRKSVEAFTQPDQPVGCMVSIACLNVPPALATLREYMAEQRHASEAAVASRIERGIADGDVPPGSDAAALAAYFSTVSRGLVIQALDGAPLERLHQIVDLAMQAWPARGR